MSGAALSDQQWHVGAHVRVRGRRWRVDGVTAGEDCEVLRLTDLESSEHRSLTLLTPFDRPINLDRPPLPMNVRPRRWLHELDDGAVP